MSSKSFLDTKVFSSIIGVGGGPLGPWGAPQAPPLVLGKHNVCSANIMHGAAIILHGPAIILRGMTSI